MIPRINSASLEAPESEVTHHEFCPMANSERSTLCACDVLDAEDLEEVEESLADDYRKYGEAA